MDNITKRIEEEKSKDKDRKICPLSKYDYACAHSKCSLWLDWANACAIAFAAANLFEIAENMKYLRR